MSAPLETSDAKDALRIRARLLRRSVHAHAGPQAALALRDVALSWRSPPPGSVVAGYWPTGSEIDVRPLLEALARKGCVCALPVVRGPGRPLLFRRWTPGEALDAGPHGTRHPVSRAVQVVPDILYVPLLAFDRTCARLGQGGGHYDRTIAALREAGSLLAVGAGYAAQEVPKIPFETHDARLDAVVTENGVIEPQRE